MSHPLDGALAHVDRADRDFEELERIVGEYLEPHKSNPFQDYDPRHLLKFSFDFSTQKRIPLPPVPVKAAVLVSAIVHHLRAALDYVVYELAFYDCGGIVQDGTQFIIEDLKTDPVNPKAGFDYRARRYLKGLSPKHVSAIERRQPYFGVEWTAVLRDISNPDKHRKLTPLQGSGAAWVNGVVVQLPAPSIKRRPGDIVARGLTSGRQIHIQTDSSFDVVLPKWDDRPLLKTLDILKEKVRATVDAFKPEFK